VWRQPPQEDEGGDARETHGGGPRVHGPEIAGEVGDAREESAVAVGDAEDLGELPDGDRQPEAEEEPGHHGLGDEVGDRAEAQGAR
jgi:hypothetical protein